MHGDPELKRARISRSKFLELILKKMEKPDIKHREFTALSKLYADTAGWKELRKDKIARKKKQAQEAEQPKAPTMDEMIMQLEKESKNGS